MSEHGLKFGLRGPIKFSNATDLLSVEKAE